MSHAELSQCWLTARETRSLTALMRPLFHTNSSVSYHHSPFVIHGWLTDLHKGTVRCARRWFVSPRHLRTTESQRSRLRKSITSICFLWDSHMSSLLTEHLKATLCHLPVILTLTTLLLITGYITRIFPNTSCWKSKINTLLNVFFSDMKHPLRAVNSK